MFEIIHFSSEMCLEQAVTIHALLNENICPYGLLDFNEGILNIFDFFLIIVIIQVRNKNIKNPILSMTFIRT